MTIATSLLQSELGTFVLQGDDQGITRIVLPGSRSRPKETVRVTPGQADLLEEAAKQITEFINGERTIFNLPLSISGTDFQMRVWDIIKHIPFGHTVSYSEIGQQLGNKKKARAVGGAANANPVPLVIPCHRVIGADGNLTGFAGGLKMKKRLLALEKERHEG